MRVEYGLRAEIKEETRKAFIERVVDGTVFSDLRSGVVWMKLKTGQVLDCVDNRVYSIGAFSSLDMSTFVVHENARLVLK